MNQAENIAERLKEHGENLFDVNLFTLGDQQVTLLTLIVVGVILFLTLLVSWLMRRAVAGLLRRKRVADEGTIRSVARLTHYALLFIGIGIGLHTAGVNLSALFAAGALFAVALGFALQDLGENLTAGITLLTERSIKPGDVLRLDGRLVQVRHMGLRATVARTLDGEDVVVPNGILAKDQVTNLTFRDALYRVRVGVGVTYASDMQRVRAELEEVAGGVGWGSKARPPIVLMSDFGSSSVDWEVSVWTEDPWKERRHQSVLREAIWDAFAAAGIVIAFPQVDVHFDPPVIESLGALRPVS